MQIHPAPGNTNSLVPLPEQPTGVPWPGPLPEDWPTGPLPDGVDAGKVNALLDRAFGTDPDPRFGQSFATLIIQGGRIVAERYGPTSGPDTAHLSWSMAKSITHALVGILVAEGRLDPLAPAPVPEWSSADDPRREITLDHLLRMVDGLDFCESYALPAAVEDEAGQTSQANQAVVPGQADQPVQAVGPAAVPFSHCIDMLFGSGSQDHAGYAAARPLAHRPGEMFNYSSGTANIVARIVCDLIGRGENGVAWMRERLFDPIGMSSATPSFDTAGNFVGSSFFHATARDYARFGLLYIRDGRWGGDGDKGSSVGSRHLAGAGSPDEGPPDQAPPDQGSVRQVLPAGWVDYARTRRATTDEGDVYGAHWWLADDGRGTFYPSGYEWQRVMCVPTSDLVIVRLGKTLEEDYDTPVQWMKDLIAEFDQLSPVH